MFFSLNNVLVLLMWIWRHCCSGKKNAWGLQTISGSVFTWLSSISYKSCLLSRWSGTMSVWISCWIYCWSFVFKSLAGAVFGMLDSPTDNVFGVIWILRWCCVWEEIVVLDLKRRLKISLLLLLFILLGLSWYSSYGNYTFNRHF